VTSDDPAGEFLAGLGEAVQRMVESPYLMIAAVGPLTDQDLPVSALLIPTELIPFTRVKEFASALATQCNAEIPSNN